MTQNLQELIKIYALDSHVNFNTHLLGQSKDTLIALLSELLTLYINDKNSSTIREILSVSLAGYMHNTEKLDLMVLGKMGLVSLLIVRQNLKISALIQQKS
ncbi:hypothetical protein [Helicobacter turcicus]|uniref:hypothetical protein n=1 Tax=Helicobacter turcicus TaxID=2867412 RepID=UPI001F328BDF|nr:hypothetical protein [Helicobacter turcicus]